MERTSHSTRAGSRASKRYNKKKTQADELCANFDNLPSPLIAHILLQLDIKSILVVRSVCKKWKALISEPHFARLHFERAQTGFMIRANDSRRVSRTLYLLDCESEKFETGNSMKLDPMFKLPLRDAIKNKSKRPLRAAARLALEKNNENLYIACDRDHDKFNIVNSCNGLLCLCPSYGQNPLVVCNPVTGEFVRLPESTTAGITKTRVRMEGNVGFGFQPKTDEYKVIIIWVRNVRLAYEWTFKRVSLEGHTLGTPSWQNVEVNPQIPISRLYHPTCMNGALHWIRFNRSQMSILFFNFKREMLQSFPSPPGVFENNNQILLHKEHIRMGELRGFLYICEAPCFLRRVSIWIMKKYGIGESWSKIYNIDTIGSPDLSLHYGFCWPLKHNKEGSSFMLYLNKSNGFFYFEHKKKRVFKLFGIHGIQSEAYEVIPHIPSLISLKDVVKEDNTEVLNINSRCAKVKLQEEDEVVSLVQEYVYDMTRTDS